MLVAGCVLLLALPVSAVVNSGAGAVVVAVASLTALVGYQRIGSKLESLIEALGGARPVETELANFYLAGLAICHLVPLQVLLYVADGAYWLHRHPPVALSVPDELPQAEAEGVYFIENARVMPSMAFRETVGGLRSTQEARLSNRDPSTTWQVMPWVSRQAGREAVERAVRSGDQCTWLGSNDSPAWIEDSLTADDESRYFRQRASRDVQRYLRLLQEGVGGGGLPVCIRVVERIPPPDQIQDAYFRAALIALGLAHGVPVLLLLVFYGLSRAKKRGHRQPM